jgi:hypothetical protein
MPMPSYVPAVEQQTVLKEDGGLYLDFQNVCPRVYLSN